MIIVDLVLEFLYLLSVAVIWLMLFYQGILTFAGYLYSRRRSKAAGIKPEDLPFVSILIPARNEEKVINDTVHALFGLDYPHDKLELFIINDGSTDKTREILESIKDERLKVLNVPAEESGKGKSRALNRALGMIKGEVIAVYDADNRPEREALRMLVSELVAGKTSGFVAAIGKFRTINKARSFMTRFQNIESFSFQWIIQAGRSFLFDIAILPGTNFVIYKKALQDVGGWNEEALTEDAELSMRIYKAGFKIKFVPGAVTWEQEPEKIKIWLKQRERWVRGNNFVTRKIFAEFGTFRNKVIGVEFMFFFSMYYIFFFAMVFSDIFFLLGLFGIVNIGIPGPFLEVWITAYMLFVSEIVLTLSREPNEDSPANIFYVVLMYFTYCQLWIIVVFSAFVKDFVTNEKFKWYKTERFAETSK